MRPVLRFGQRSMLGRGVVLIAAVVLGSAVSWALLAAPSRASGPATTVTVQLSPPTITADGASTSLATAAVTDRFGSPVAQENVVFSSSDPGDKIGPVIDNQNGTYTATITSTTVGTATITAADTSAPLPASGQAILTKTPGPGPGPGPASAVNVTLSPASIGANGSSTSVATAAVTDAGGHPVSGETISFSSSDPGERVSSTANNHDGTYSATITSSTTVGFATITATDTSISPYASGSARLAQAANASTTTLMALPSAPVTNQAVTLIATVTSSSSAASPSGKMTFEMGGTPIGGCTVVPVATGTQSATVTCQTSFSASTSPEQLIAVFVSNRGSLVTDSRSATDNLVVGPDATSTALDVSNPTVKLGSSATYTATVAPGHAGPVRPSGSVVFLDRGAPIGSCLNQPLLDSSAFAAATCTVIYKKAGAHLLTAHYGGNNDFYASTSPPQPVSVRRLPVQVLGTITATMRWTFYYTPAYTKLLAFVVDRASAGTTILVKCRGHGCPFAKRAISVTKRKRCSAGRNPPCSSPDPETVDLMPSFRGRRLTAGSGLTVELIKSGLIGKRYQFKIRAGRPPLIRIRCLARVGKGPGFGC